MAGLTKEQRDAKKRLEEEKLRTELEEKIRLEYEAKLEKKVPEANINKKVIPTKYMSIPLDTLIPVTCNVKGGAIYISKRINGYTITWDEFGSTEYLELAELVAMRNSDRRFFEDNWIICEDTEDFTAMHIYDFLKVAKYYKNIFTPENIDTIFEKEPSEIIKNIAPLSKGLKETIAVRAKEKIDSGDLDSTKKINAFESALNMQFSI